MIKSVTGPGDRDGGPSATARAEEARRTWPRAAAATPLNSEPTESEAQWKSWPDCNSSAGGVENK